MRWRAKLWQDALRYGGRQLQRIMSADEAGVHLQEWQRYLRRIGISQTVQRRDAKAVMTAGEHVLWRKFVHLRVNERVPMQYIIHEWDFRNLTLTQRAPVLICRPETEVSLARPMQRPDLNAADSCRTHPQRLQIAYINHKQTAQRT